MKIEELKEENNYVGMQWYANQKAITLIALIITIIILLILAGVTLSLTIGENGIINIAQVASEKTNKETATEKINLKITAAQMNSYTKSQRMPTLEELAIALDADSEIEYVHSSKTVASLTDIDFTTTNSIFTKLIDFPYEFEINSSLQLASIDGVQISSNNVNNTDWTFLGKLTGKGNETSNYIDLTKIQYKEIYIYTETDGGYSYEFNIIKDRLSNDIIYPQLGIDSNYRVGIAMNKEKTWIYCAWENGNNVEATTTVYYYYK